jgi:uncharacterized protein YwlG (UPF0340 family)
MNANADRGFLRAYGALVALYPREFRDEYGADMVQLARDACRDDPPWRVACRVLVDLAISIPTQHLELHMHRSPSPLIPLIYSAVSGAGVVLALAGGTNVSFLVVGLAVAAIAGMLAVIAWRRAAPVGGSVQTTHWWKLVVAGPVIIGGVIVAAGLGVDAWFVGMFFVFLALILTGVGLLLGLARLTARRPPSLPT